MASAKSPAIASSVRRKPSKSPLLITLRISPKNLARFGSDPLVKEESPFKDVSSPSTSDTLAVAASSSSGNPSKSAAGTPPAVGTPNSSMPPPSEGVKKKGVKRSSAVALGADAPPKVRGKPGPKKKARLEDGTIDHSNTTPKAVNTAGPAHKLGPKANQGAINAGLRALDRSGKPCRKWNKGGFALKSFTGVLWQIPRWTAPPRPKPEAKSEEPASGDSSKENKDNSQIESEKSNNGIDVEMASAPSQAVGSSRAPSLPPAGSSPAEVVIVATPA